MFTVIDSARPATLVVRQLAQAGIRVVMRYYNHKDVSLPGKRLTRAEARTLTEAGLSIGAVFQQRGGGNGGHIGDLTAMTGQRDAARALQVAADIGQPQGSAIYFAVDWDFITKAELASIEAYFGAVNAALAGSYRVGVYGSGLVCDRLLTKGLVKFAWLSQSQGWSGHDDFLKSQRWALAQAPATTLPGTGYRYDPNYSNTAFPDFGQFTLNSGADEFARDHAAPEELRSMMQVTARSGLLLRRGAGTSYERIRSLPFGTRVFGISVLGDWVLVDTEGDGKADGYCHRGYLELVADAFGMRHPALADPYQIAREELADNIHEFPGKKTNPRIYLYHASTGHGDEDSVPWCSSFVNYCVEKAGLKGTNSKAARSWHEQGWGDEVTEAPREGDIVVWRRQWTNAAGQPESGGHVGFLVSANATSITVLGGNQSGRVSIASYPRNGSLGGQHYKLLSIRRAVTMTDSDDMIIAEAAE
ncbi:TIGR02594 family protein [Paracoccus spongiarum]|uniref:N-acetylmuramoyl-L-alanine amidase n=1 Tax=Paracoccus spongiarum TaxID=3064387 RepID=A0ABT9JGS2_9RHOB|nr:TIGR02594 family protein [Paracoccus sp. 2205BS29-5]MDP5309027.1 TIGR02594 family protein [Paracoccus sp. 2205BS29-5]